MKRFAKIFVLACLIACTMAFVGLVVFSINLVFPKWEITEIMAALGLTLSLYLWARLKELETRVDILNRNQDQTRPPVQ
jgi:hypothetical protein